MRSEFFTKKELANLKYADMDFTQYAHASQVQSVFSKLIPIIIETFDCFFSFFNLNHRPIPSKKEASISLGVVYCSLLYLHPLLRFFLFILMHVFFGCVKKNRVIPSRLINSNSGLCRSLVLQIIGLDKHSKIYLASLISLKWSWFDYICLKWSCFDKTLLQIQWFHFHIFG